MEYLLIYIGIISLITFIAYGADKRKAQKKEWRTPEAVLITLAAVGGSIGAIAGMRFFHHKTRKPKFYIGVPAILIAQIAVGIAIWILFYK